MSETRPGDKRAYFHVDVGYLANPKIAPLLDDQPRAILLHLQCIAYSAQHLTDGVVPMRLAMRLACAEQCDLDLLLQYGLLEQVDGANVMVHDYLEHQRSSEKVKSASDKGKQAAKARWDAVQKDATSNATSMPDPLPNPMPRERDREKEQTLSARRGRFEEFWAAFPKRGKHSNPKEPARQKFNEIVRTVDPQILIDAALVLAKLREGEDPQTTPQVKTWLTQRRWEDQPAEEAPQSKGFFSPPPVPEDMPPNLFVKWNSAHAAAYRAGKTGPSDWRELMQVSA